MEKHKTNLIINPNNEPSLNDNYFRYFEKALAFAKDNYQEEIDRISSTNFNHITREFFYKEFVWCVVVSGFNARVASKFFDELWCELRPLLPVLDGFPHVNSLDVGIRTMDIFANKRKIKAMIDGAFIIGNKIQKYHTWELYKENELNDPESLQKLPYIGPITCYHLARNIGLTQYVKPDLHLIRLCKLWNFQCPIDMCAQIQYELQEKLPLGIIDLVLWYSASTFGTNSKSLI